ncbi:OmpA family protein [Fulvivirga sediminis]|uniref:PD40 domain-containing protein n=1 Tax=Fulvivirga sediminis TaxID=2803949 RepID=A0A937K0I4_9BACT|nr:OmpA family protein [Fulvivirga sediminis]MBL3658388.1 PD40 domain-containing protein [Fulvivirga sediminis]
MKHFYYFLSCCLFFCTQVHAQEDPVALAEEYLQQASQIYSQQKEAIEIAKELFVKAAELDPNNVKANWMAGQLYLETINKDQALKYLLRVQEKKPSYRFDIWYQIGRAYHYGLDFNQALDYYKKYEHKVTNDRHYRGRDRVLPEDVRRRIVECNNGKEIINQPARYSVEVLEPGINSVWPDYAPVMNEDETVMIFTSRRQEGNTSADVDKDNFYFEDIFISRKVGGKWGEAENIGPPINTAYHDANIALSADGNRLYLYKDVGRGDIFYSDFVNGEWTEPKFLTDKINSSVYSENSITETSSSDVVFYTSDRPGGFGGIDIYMCIKDDKGRWYKSKSLGPVINTKFDEESPFLAYDGKTLYFSSAGHKGYGGYDIFKSVYDSLKGEWSEPQNLGYPVNTPDDEIYFRASKDGRIGYYSSVREGGLGFTDIFRVKYHGSGKKMSGSELIAQAKKEKERAEIENLSSEESNATNMPSLPVDAKFEAHEMKLMDHAHRIYFNAAQSAIDEVHREELDSIISLLNKYKVLDINISGFASADGNPRYNLQLSQKRALIVLDYFVSHGVPEERIVAQGFGAVKAEGGGDPEENRRADVSIVARE